MGNVIKFGELKRQIDLISHLIIYGQNIKDLPSQPVSISKPLSHSLIEIPSRNRTMRFTACFKNVMSQYPDNVVIKDIDVMFNPSYQVDVLTVLTETRKTKNYSLVWPGRIEGGLLIYSEEGYPDYETFKIADYDITCVI